MEVDELGATGGGGGGSGDPENQLVSMFSSMATEDKDNLVKALQAVVGSGVSPVSCKFFLELANWNLSAAIGAYYDFDFSQQQQQQQQAPHPNSAADADEAVASSPPSTASSLPRLAILSCELLAICDATDAAAAAAVCTVYNESPADCQPGCRLVAAWDSDATAAAASAAAAAAFELCQLPGLPPGGNCRLRFRIPPPPSSAAAAAAAAPSCCRVRLRLHAPDGTPLDAPASARCLDLADQPAAAAAAAGDAESADADAAIAAAYWASVEPPALENPPPSPAHNDDQMME